VKSPYQIIRRPVITEKGLGVKETQSTLVFQVAPKATKTEIKEAVQAIFKVKVDSVRTANFPPRTFCRLSSRLEESLRAPEVRREDAGVRAKPLVVGYWSRARRARVTLKLEAKG